MGNLNIYLFNFLFFFLLGYFLQFLFIPKLKKLFLDVPNKISLHKNPMPTSGGVFFVFLGTLGSLYFKFYLPLACLPLAITGLIDDRFNISIKIRFFMQILTALILKSFSILSIDTNNLFLDNFLELILIISLIAIINFINFMDGIDGLVAGSMIIYFSIFSLVVTPSLIPLVGSLAAFLVVNWSPAKIFMGDVGSTFLGALFAGLLLQMPTWEHSFQLMLIASPLFVDPFFCVIRRFLNKENVFHGHQKHLFQRLINQRGFSVPRISLMYISASILCSFSMYFGGIKFLILNFLLILMVGIYLDKVIARPFVIQK